MLVLPTMFLIIQVNTAIIPRARDQKVPIPRVMIRGPVLRVTQPPARRTLWARRNIRVHEQRHVPLVAQELARCAIRAHMLVRPDVVDVVAVRAAGVTAHHFRGGSWRHVGLNR